VQRRGFRSARGRILTACVRNASGNETAPNSTTWTIQHERGRDPKPANRVSAGQRPAASAPEGIRTPNLLIRRWPGPRPSRPATCQIVHDVRKRPRHLSTSCCLVRPRPHSAAAFPDPSLTHPGCSLLNRYPGRAPLRTHQGRGAAPRAGLQDLPEERATDDTLSGRPTPR